MQKSIQGLNLKFHVNIVSLSGGYQLAIIRGQLPTFTLEWLADYPDAHNFIFPFMSSSGTFSGWQNYSNAEVDDLIAQGISAATSAERDSIYRQLDQLYIDEVPSFIIDQPLGRRYFRDWVTGWYFNPVLPSHLGYIYTLGKE